MLDALLIFRMMAALLSRPNATFTSILQIAKRIRVADDKIRRSTSRLEEKLGVRLLVTQGRRLTLTPAGVQLADLAGRIDALREGTFRDGPESFVIDADAILADTLLPHCFPALFEVYADTLKVEVSRFDPSSTPERLDAGDAHIGIGWAEGDGSSLIEVLDVAVPWVVALPPQLSFTKRAVPEGGLAEFDRVFLSADERSLATTASALAVVPAGRRVELPSVAAVLAVVASGCGVGVVPALPWHRPVPLRTVPLAGLEPDRPAIFLPRRSSDLTEVAGSLLAILKQVAPRPFSPEPHTTPAPSGQEPSVEPTDLVSA